MSLLKNAIYNISGSAIPLLISLFTIPLYIQAIGEVKFGILSIIWLVIGYIGFLDLGLGRAVAQKISKSRSTPIHSVYEIYSTSIFIGILLSLFISSLIILFFNFILKYNVFQENLIFNELYDARYWIAAAFPVSVISGILAGALQGFERFKNLNFSNIIGSVLIQVLPLLSAKYYSDQLSVLISVVILSRLVVLLINFYFCRNLLMRNKFFLINLKVVSEIFTFGGWVSLSSLAEMAMVAGDRFLIGFITGAKNVTFYAIPFQFGERSLIVSRSIASALIPKLAYLSEDKISINLKAGVNLLVFVTTPIIAGVMIFFGKFLEIWISPEFSMKSNMIGVILFFAFWVNGINIVIQSKMESAGHPEIMARYNIITFIPYFILLYFLVIYIGPIGAAIAFLAKQVIDSFFISNFTRLFRLIVAEFFIHMLLLIILTISLWLSLEFAFILTMYLFIIFICFKKININNFKGIFNQEII